MPEVLGHTATENQTSNPIDFTIEESRGFLSHLKEEFDGRISSKPLADKKAYLLSNFLEKRLNVGNVQPGDRFVVTGNEAIRYNKKGTEKGRVSLGPRMRKFMQETLEIGATTGTGLRNLAREVTRVQSSNEVAADLDRPIPPNTSINQVFEIGKKWSKLKGGWSSKKYAKAIMVQLFTKHLSTVEIVDLSIFDRLGSSQTNLKLAQAISGLEINAQRAIFEMLGDIGQRRNLESQFQILQEQYKQEIETRSAEVLGKNMKYIGFNIETKPWIKGARKGIRLLEEKSKLLEMLDRQPRMQPFLNGIVDDLMRLESQLPKYIRGGENWSDKVIISDSFSDRAGKADKPEKGSTHEQGLAMDFKISGYSERVLTMRKVYLSTLATASEEFLQKFSERGNSGSKALLAAETNQSKEVGKTRKSGGIGGIHYIDESKRGGTGPHYHVNLSRWVSKLDDQTFDKMLSISRMQAREAANSYLNRNGTQLASVRG